MISLQRKCNSPLVCVMLAFGILIGSFSVIQGLCIVSGPDHPEISLDVCHPIQGINLVTIVSIARPASNSYEPSRFPADRVVAPASAKILDLSFAPDPPPPKSLA